MRKDALYTSVATVLTLLAAAPSHAQDAPPPTSSSNAADSSAEAQDNSSGIQDIIVTAERRSESAQRTPLVITVLDSEDLRGLSDVRQLQAVSPGVTLAAAGNVVQTFVRGVGSLNATNYQEGSVAYNIDGVFLYTSTMITPLIYDLERVEVLKGPQGTLYGRNASGGVVNLITNGARLGRVEGYMEGEVGNYDLRRLTGAMNVPIGDTLAIRLSGQHAEHDGYLSDGTDDQDVTAGRARLLWEPSPAVSLKLGVDASRTDAMGAGTTVEPNNTGVKFIGALDPRANLVSSFAGGTAIVSLPPNPEPHLRDKQWSSFGQLDVDVGFATLTVLPAYRYEHSDSLSYVPGYSYSENTRTRQKSIEARLANQNSFMKWVLGAYYFQVKQAANVNVRNEPNFLNVTTITNNEVKSYAFFGEATVNVADAIRIIGGIRYTHEKTGINGIVNEAIGFPGVINPITQQLNVQTSAFNPFNPFTNPTGELLDYPIHVGTKEHAITWKGGAEFDVTPDSMLFFTASRGFKGGGNYVDVPIVNSQFTPEFLTAFELGSRNRFLDNRLQLNAELFYWKLKDQQIPYLGFNSIGQVSFITANAGKSHMYGGTLDVTWRATSNDTLHAGVEYVKSKYDSFVRVVPVLTVLPSTLCSVSTPASPSPTEPVTLDCSGFPVLRAPKWSGVASYEHRFDLGNGSDIVANGDMTFGSSRFLDAVYTDVMKQGAYALFNASLTYNSPGKKFSLTGWIRNIGNERVKTGGGQFFSHYGRPTVLPPRTVGVSGRVSF